MNNLLISRDERQAECVRKWLQNKGKGTIIACTGFGKTKIAIDCIKRLLRKYPKLRVLIVVPTEVLKNQWNSILDENSLGLNCEVQIINTVAKNGYECDLVVYDEAHRLGAEVLSQALETVKYKLILCLTATLERLDGRHELITKYAPVVDSISIEVAKLNGWVANFTEYQVIISVDDIDKYQEYNAEFNRNFEFFQYDWNLAMSMIGPKGFINRAKYRDQLCESNTDEAYRKEVFKKITFHATAFMRALQARKKFIHNHQKKLEIAKEIIKHRSDKKIITFSANTQMADKLDSLLKDDGFINSFVYTGKDGKKKNRTTMEEFSTLATGVLNNVKLCIEGVDVKGLSTAIVMGVDSSSIKATQISGRAIRKEEDTKYAEVFTLVIEDSQEVEWYRKSHQNVNYVTIDEENLMKILKGEPYEMYKRKLKNFTYRF